MSAVTRALLAIVETVALLGRVHTSLVDDSAIRSPAAATCRGKVAIPEPLSAILP